MLSRQIKKWESFLIRNIASKYKKQKKLCGQSRKERTEAAEERCWNNWNTARRTGWKGFGLF